MTMKTPLPSGSMGYFRAAPSSATVESMNPLGGMFTLPRSFIDAFSTSKLYSSTAFTGYTSFSFYYYVNGRARFRPNNPYGATMTARVVFPTTQGNPEPNQGNLGSAVTPTTTFDGDFTFSRVGSLHVTPGPRRFGGTMRLLYDVARSKYSQYDHYYAPTTVRRGYGSFNFKYKGSPATEDLETRVKKVNTMTAYGGTFTPPTSLLAGQITSTGMVTFFLAAPTLWPVTMTTHFGMSPIKSPSGYYRKLASPPATTRAYYLHLIAPWTTGAVSVYDPDGSYTPDMNANPRKHIRPKMTGFDKVYATPGGMDVSLTNLATRATYMGGQTNYYYYTSMEQLKGVTRVVSLVRPRIIHSYAYPRFASDPPQLRYHNPRLWSMNVYFLPEPGALLMLGSAVAGLGGLYLLRRNR